MLHDPDVISVSIDDAGGGSFDDIVVRQRIVADTFIQAKSSNTNAVVIDSTWLCTPTTPNGRSPLQHFYATYVSLLAAGKEFTVELWTNRSFDAFSPLLGTLLDKSNERIDTARLLAATPRTKIGKERDDWANHLGVTASELAAFLDTFYWRHTTSETGWHTQSKRLMELSGLRTDEDAINSGVLAVRGWVKDGGGPKTADDVRLDIAKRGLLARDGTLLLAVHGIERTVTPTPPNMEVDFVDLYDGEAPFKRKQLRDPSLWDNRVRPDIDEAARVLKAFGVQRVHVAGSMRLPMWFAVGRALPRVGKFILSIEQVGGEWSTGVEPELVVPREVSRKNVGAGPDVAIALGFSADPTPEVMSFLTASGLPIDRLVVFGPPGALSHTSVPSGAWALGWTRAARDLIRVEVAAAGASKVHVFMLCPSGIALMLGHHWNMLPDTTLYEFVGKTYEPTITLPGA